MAALRCWGCETLLPARLLLRAPAFAPAHPPPASLPAALPLLPQVGPFDRLSIKGLTSFAPGKGLTLVGKRPDGSTYEFPVNHTFNANQINVSPPSPGRMHARARLCPLCFRRLRGMCAEAQGVLAKGWSSLSLSSGQTTDRLVPLPNPATVCSGSSTAPHSTP